MSRRSRPVRLSVRVRILATLLLVAGLGMAVAGATAYLVQRERVLSAVDERLVALAGDAGEVAAESGSAASATLDTVMTDVVQRVRPGSNESALGIIDGRAALSPGGTVAFRIDRNQALVDRVVTETAAGEVVRGTLSEPGAPALRYIAVPVVTAAGGAAAGGAAAGGAATGAGAAPAGGADARAAVFVVAVDLEAELAPLTDAFRTYAVIAAIALVVVGVVGWFVAGRLLRPIRSLTAAATRITGSDLSERIPVTGRDDISQLTVTVNGMLDRLEGALTAQRQLLDDVGHELKTPITIVRGHLELVDAGDPLDVAATRALALDELDRMSGLVTDIARLAEAGRPGALVRAPVDVAELTGRIQAKAMALADRRWVVVRRAEGVAVLDADRITQAVLQLAANAVAHGAPSGPSGPGADGSSEDARIEIGSAWGAAGALEFWVRDFGVGVPADARERIFERFQRGPAHGRGSGGSGLGLAIVSSIAEAHGGHAELDSPPGGGALFRIVIPAAPGAGADAAAGAGADSGADADAGAGAAAHHRATAQTSTELAASEQTATGQAPSEQAATGQTATGRTVTEQAIAEQAASGPATTGKTVTEKATAEQAATAQAAREQAVTGQAASGPAATGETITEQATAEQAATAQAAREQATAEQAVTGQVASGQAATGQAGTAQIATENTEGQT